LNAISLLEAIGRFWFRVYSPHRSRWHDYSLAEKEKLLQDHASTVFEDYCRDQFTDASRYWEADLEFDLVRNERRDDGQQTLIISEVKWRHLTAADRRRIETQLEGKWQRSTLRHRHPNVAFEVLDPSVLKRVRRESGSHHRARQQTIRSD
jgi:hypothetical protein